MFFKGISLLKASFVLQVEEIKLKPQIRIKDLSFKVKLENWPHSQLTWAFVY